MEFVSYLILEGLLRKYKDSIDSILQNLYPSFDWRSEGFSRSKFVSSETVFTFNISVLIPQHLQGLLERVFPIETVFLNTRKSFQVQNHLEFK